MGNNRRRPHALFTQLPDHPARSLHPVPMRFLRTVGSLGAQSPLLRPQFPRTADFDTLSEHHRLERRRTPPLLGHADRHHAADAGVPRILRRGAVARGQQGPKTLLRLHLHRGRLHLYFGAGLLRLRNTREQQAPRFRQRAVVGVDERHDRRGRDIPRDDHRQDILRDAPLAGHDVLPDLHDLRTAGVLAQKRVRPIGRTPLFGETSPISSAPSAGRGFR